jgi:hypothetical protein
MELETDCRRKSQDPRGAIGCVICTELKNTAEELTVNIVRTDRRKKGIFAGKIRRPKNESEKALPRGTGRRFAAQPRMPENAGGLSMATAVLTPGTRLADSLLAKLDGAQAAVRRQPTIAIQLLESFIQEVQAESGISLEPETATRLALQAQRIIDVVYEVSWSSTALFPIQSIQQEPAFEMV